MKYQKIALFVSVFVNACNPVLAASDAPNAVATDVATDVRRADVFASDTYNDAAQTGSRDMAIQRCNMNDEWLRILGTPFVREQNPACGNDVLYAASEADATRMMDESIACFRQWPGEYRSTTFYTFTRVGQDGPVLSERLILRRTDHGIECIQLRQYGGVHRSDFVDAVVTVTNDPPIFTRGTYPTTDHQGQPAVGYWIRAACPGMPVMADPVVYDPPNRITSGTICPAPAR